jgi:flagellar biosynthesis protein FlhG
MARDPVARDWELLGLAPEASPEEVRAAYARRRGLYDPEALATYSLHDFAEREALLDRLDDAYRAISAQLGDLPAPSSAAPAPQVEATADPTPAADLHPGAFLRHQRMARQVTTARLASETKIRASMLDLLESEDFGALPAPVYVRGFVVQCARALKLDDPEGLAERYIAKMRAAIGDDA